MPRGVLHLATVLLALCLLIPASAQASENPLRGLRLFVDRHFGAPARQVRTWARSRPHDARLIEKIARQPTVKPFGAYTSDPASEVRGYLARQDEESPGSTPVVNLYRLPHERCGNYDAGGSAGARSYRRWMEAFAGGIGRHRMVIFLEEDSLISTPCLNRGGLRVRLALLRYATDRLARLPHVVVYQDAGAADALSVGVTVRLLRQAGISRSDGFMLNATHYDSTSREVRYGLAISRALNGKHFVVNTSANGRGPLIARDRIHEILCNPPGRGLGTAPTLNTHHRAIDGFLWTGEPGHSNGRCHPGDPPPGAWWPQYALGLARRAVF